MRGGSMPTDCMLAYVSIDTSPVCCGREQGCAMLTTHNSAISALGVRNATAAAAAVTRNAARALENL